MAYLFLGSPAKEGCGATEGSSQKGYEDNEGTGAPVVLGLAERAGPV